MTNAVSNKRIVAGAPSGVTITVELDQGKTRLSGVMATRSS
jgi:hypothetical protein